MGGRAKKVGTAVAAAAGCFGDFMFWAIVLPMAFAFLAFVVIEPTAVGAAMFWGALIVIVAALFVVFVTATFGYVRSKRLALEREMRDEHVCHECEPADRR